MGVIHQDLRLSGTVDLFQASRDVGHRGDSGPDIFFRYADGQGGGGRPQDVVEVVPADEGRRKY